MPPFTSPNLSDGFSNFNFIKNEQRKSSFVKNKNKSSASIIDNNEKILLRNEEKLKNIKRQKNRYFNFIGKHRNNSRKKLIKTQQNRTSYKPLKSSLLSSYSDSILNLKSSSSSYVPSISSEEDELIVNNSANSLTNSSNHSSSIDRLKQYTNILIYLKNATTLNTYYDNQFLKSNQERNTYIEKKYKECLNDLEKAKLNLINTNTKMNSSYLDNKMVKNNIVEDQLKLTNKTIQELDKDKLEVKGLGNGGSLILVSDQLQRQSPLNLLSINDLINSCYSNSKNKTENATISSSSSSSLISREKNGINKTNDNVNNNKNIIFFDNDPQEDLDYDSQLQQQLDDLFIVEPTDRIIENEKLDTKEGVVNSKLLFLSILYSLSEPNISSFNSHNTNSNNNEYIYFEAINKTLSNQKNADLVKCLLSTSSQQQAASNNKINLFKKNFDIIDSILRKYDYYCSNTSSAMHNYFCKRIKLISKENLNLSYLDLNDLFATTLTSSTSFNSYESIQLLKKSSSCSNLSSSNNKNFEHFLSNVIKGKQKSTLLYNQQLHIDAEDEAQQLLSQAQIIMPAEEEEPVVVPTEETVQKVKTNHDCNDKILKSNNDIDIPDEIRGALVSAGIDITQIINLKNQIEMKINSDDKINGVEVVEIKNELKNSIQEQSKVRQFEIKHDKSAKITQTVEKENGEIIRIPNQNNDDEKEKTKTVCQSPSLSSLQQKTIIPAKEIPLFKPILIQKHRTLNTPTPINLNHLIISSPTDSFNDLSSENTKLKSNISSYSINDDNRSSSKTLDNKTDDFKIPGIPTSISHIENISFLSQLKKKPSVTRSFSYNISKLVNGSNNANNVEKTKKSTGDYNEANENIKNSTNSHINNKTSSSSIPKQIKQILISQSSSNGINLKTNVKNTSTIISDLPSPSSSSSLMKFSTNDENKNSLDHIYHVSIKMLIIYHMHTIHVHSILR